jgi:hypothetical protein
MHHGNAVVIRAICLQCRPAPDDMEKIYLERQVAVASPPRLELIRDFKECIHHTMAIAISHKSFLHLKSLDGSYLCLKKQVLESHLDCQWPFSLLISFCTTLVCTNSLLHSTIMSTIKPLWLVAIECLRELRVNDIRAEENWWQDVEYNWQSRWNSLLGSTTGNLWKSAKRRDVEVVSRIP